MSYASQWTDPTWMQNQANRLGQLGAGRGWGAQMVKGALGTVQPAGAEFKGMPGATSPSGPGGLDYLGIGKGTPALPGAPGSAPAPSGNVPVPNPNPIMSNLGQTVAGGPSGLSAGIGRYRPPQATPAIGTMPNMVMNALASRMNMPSTGLAAPAHASGEIGGRSFGDNPAAFGANQQLAGALPGFKGNFGGGRFSEYMKGASGGEQMTAETILRALGQGGRIDWNPATSVMPFVPMTPTGPTGQAAAGGGAPAVDPEADRLGLLPGGHGTLGP